MNIYRISQRKNRSYDTYDSAVVIADSEEAASKMHPDGSSNNSTLRPTWDTWAAPAYVEVELIGYTDSEEKPRVVCASFNAG